MLGNRRSQSGAFRCSSSSPSICSPGRPARTTRALAHVHRWHARVLCSRHRPIRYLRADSERSMRVSHASRPQASGNADPVSSAAMASSASSSVSRKSSAIFSTLTLFYSFLRLLRHRPHAALSLFSSRNTSDQSTRQGTRNHA